MRFNPKGFGFRQWYMWYIQDECGADLWEQELKDKPMPSDTIIQMLLCSQTPIRSLKRMQWSSSACPGWLSIHHSLQDLSRVHPCFLLFWTGPDCQDIPTCAIVHDVDHHVSGLISQNPGCLWHYTSVVALHDWSSHQNPVCHQLQLLRRHPVRQSPSLLVQVDKCVTASAWPCNMHGSSNHSSRASQAV